MRYSQYNRELMLTLSSKTLQNRSAMRWSTRACGVNGPSSFWLPESEHISGRHAPYAAQKLEQHMEHLCMKLSIHAGALQLECVSRRHGRPQRRSSGRWCRSAARSCR